MSPTKCTGFCACLHVQYLLAALCCLLNFPGETENVISQIAGNLQNVAQSDALKFPKRSVCLISGDKNTFGLKTDNFFVFINENMQTV